MQGRFLIDNLKSEDKKDGITLVCCFSRKIFVPIFFKSLAQMQLPRKNIHLLVYDNTADKGLENVLVPLLKNLMGAYKSVRFFKSFLPPLWKVAGSKVFKFSDSKVFNIWAMWTALKELIYTPLFFQLEDDTIAPAHAFEKLFAELEARPNAAYVTGISTGRHVLANHPVKLGVYTLKMANFKILERHALSPHTEGVVPVDASGVYCFAARTDKFMSGFDGFAPDEIDFPYFFLDVLFTWNIKRHGHDIFADFDVWVSHLHAAGDRINAFSKEQAVEMVDVWLPAFNNYCLSVEVNPDNRPKKLKPAPSYEF